MDIEMYDFGTVQECINVYDRQCEQCIVVITDVTGLNPFVTRTESPVTHSLLCLSLPAQMWPRPAAQLKAGHSMSFVGRGSPVIRALVLCVECTYVYPVLLLIEYESTSAFEVEQGTPEGRIIPRAELYVQCYQDCYDRD